MMQDEALRKNFRDAGVLLVLPNGPLHSWRVAGEPGVAGDDRAFVAAVAEDAARRWRLPRARFWLAGFSVGASMVWDVACHAVAGAGFAAYVAMSGQFWDRLPERCESGPVDLLQIHGLTDDVFPLEGRAIGPAHQGDLFASLALLRAHDGCRSNPDTMVSATPFVVRSWTRCTTGAEIILALHDGGHEIPDGWFALAWPFAQAAIARGN
jgi:polyhydroxybutyrate depolymerase